METTEKTKLQQADEWMDRAILQEEKGNNSMRDRCLEKAVKLEAEGLAAGETRK